MIGRFFAVLGLALLGTLLGAGLGILCGAAYVWLADTTSFEGYSAMLVFFGFGPAGALIGSIALPAIYLARLFRRPPPFPPAG